MKRLLVLCLALLLTPGLTACREEAADHFTIQLLCESDSICQVLYTCYLDGTAAGTGGIADLDGEAFTPQVPRAIPISRSFLDGAEDLSDFSITFSPYGSGDTRELGTTYPLPIPAAYGRSYTVVLSGDRRTGFQAVLQK